LDANQRKFDIVMAWSVDRPGRSLQDLVGFLSELHPLHRPVSAQQGLDTTTPAGKAMVQVMGVFAEFERSMIQERVRAGLGRAKDEGKQLGRPRIARELEKTNPCRSQGAQSYNALTSTPRAASGWLKKEDRPSWIRPLKVSPSNLPRRSGRSAKSYRNP